MVSFPKRFYRFVLGIIERIEEVRVARKLTRKEFAELMGNDMTKERWDKIVENAKKGICPHAHTLAIALEIAGLPTMPSKLFQNGIKEEC